MSRFENVAISFLTLSVAILGCGTALLDPNSTIAVAVRPDRSTLDTSFETCKTPEGKSTGIIVWGHNLDFRPEHYIPDDVQMPRSADGVRTLVSLERPIPNSTLRQFPDTPWMRYCGSTFDSSPNPDLALEEQQHLLSLLEILNKLKNCRFLAVHNATLPDGFLTHAMRIKDLELIVVIDCVEVDAQQKFVDAPDAKILLYNGGRTKD